MHIIIIQLIGLFIVYSVLQFCENSAALRGTKGEDTVPIWVHKGLRLFFLLFMVGPLLYMIPSLLIVFVPYAFTFVDLSELNGSRADTSYLNVKNWRLWNGIKSYFNLKLIKTCDLDPKKTYIFALHPHAILPFGAGVNIYTNANNIHTLFPDIKFRALAASFVFYVPIYRDILLAGGILDASRYNAHKTLENGYSLCIVPGGATEALYADKREDILVLKKRRGFIRLALKHGCSLVPVFSFNENNAFDQMAPDNYYLKRLREKFQSITGISLPILKNIIPRRANITTVFGEPMDLERNENPSEELVTKVLNEYAEHLTQHYEKHGKTYNEPPTKKLKIL